MFHFVAFILELMVFTAGILDFSFKYCINKKILSTARKKYNFGQSIFLFYIRNLYILSWLKGIVHFEINF